MENKNLTGYPSIDKPWLKYYSEEAIHAPLPTGSMYEYMASKNAFDNDAIAINYFGNKISYKTLSEKICQYSNALQNAGVHKNDTVSLGVLAMPETVYFLYAINRIGAICNMLPMTETEKEINQQIKNSKSKIIIVVDLFLDKIEKATESLEEVEKIVVVSIADSMPFPLATLTKQKLP